ncbi:hypothetical protein COV19_00185 [Candidatus Woesearchaeota archaeon CG10_big_fil_rev_8_21_14_0_10_44_13]|nr:MAG: hypothetical protein COV19_00185 [Candidatus Woesearchaeota archaeon CG10_big_fil_rev_8_21_14_0_10_44_13]
MDERPRREFLGNLWTGAKAAAGISTASKVLELLLPDNAVAQEEQPSRSLGHEANGYILTVEGYYDADKMIQADDTFKLLEFFIRKPTVINNKVYFEYISPSPAEDHQGKTGILTGEEPRLDGSRKFIYSPGSMYINRSGDIQPVLLHEFGHCWFKFMDFLVDKEWVDAFNKVYCSSKPKKQVRSRRRCS